MSRRAKHISLVIAVQTGCLGVGLWMHHHHAVSSAKRAAQQQAWSDIEEAAEALALGLNKISVTNLSSRNAVSGVLERLVGAHALRLDRVMIVDPHWQVVYPDQQLSDKSDEAAATMRRVEWSPLADTSNWASGPLRGTITLSDGPRLAAASALKDGHGYVLIHQPEAEFEAQAAVALESLPAITLMTFVWVSALLSIAVYLILSHLHDDMQRQRTRSTTDALQQTQNLLRTRDAVIFGLAKLAESRDPDTGEHLERIMLYARTLASELRDHPKYRDEITSSFIRFIGISSALHDIGKVGVEDRILLKPGRLTPQEWAAMQTHSTIGGECLREIEHRLGRSNFLQMAREIAFAHHENWDGTGYPNGLSGEAIPLSARVVALADMYDALSSCRVYKKQLPHEECVAEIRAEAGKKLDPDLVDAWLRMESKFSSISAKYGNSGETAAKHEHVEIDPVEDVQEEIEELCEVGTSAVREGK